jgi:hypothetical protein
MQINNSLASTVADVQKTHRPVHRIQNLPQGELFAPDTATAHVQRDIIPRCLSRCARSSQHDSRALRGIECNADARTITSNDT